MNEMNESESESESGDNGKIGMEWNGMNWKQKSKRCKDKENDVYDRIRIRSRIENKREQRKCK